MVSHRIRRKSGLSVDCLDACQEISSFDNVDADKSAINASLKSLLPYRSSLCIISFPP
jgi:hypothetical protein